MKGFCLPSLSIFRVKEAISPKTWWTPPRNVHVFHTKKQALKSVVQFFWKKSVFTFQVQQNYMDVSKNRGTPKWMVKIMENPIKMDDLGGKTHYFRKYPYLRCAFGNLVPVTPSGILDPPESLRENGSLPFR